MLPVAVATGVTDTDPDAALVPAELLAVTVQLYAVALVKPVTETGLAVAAPVFEVPLAVQVPV